MTLQAEDYAVLSRLSLWIVPFLFALVSWFIIRHIGKTDASIEKLERKHGELTANVTSLESVMGKSLSAISREVRTEIRSGLNMVRRDLRDEVKDSLHEMSKRVESTGIIVQASALKAEENHGRIILLGQEQGAQRQLIVNLGRILRSFQGELFELKSKVTKKE